MKLGTSEAVKCLRPFELRLKLDLVPGGDFFIQVKRGRGQTIHILTRLSPLGLNFFA